MSFEAYCKLPVGAEDEIIEYKQILEKGVLDLSRVISVLKNLTKVFVSYELLVKTKIGKNLTVLSQLQSSVAEQ